MPTIWIHFTFFVEGTHPRLECDVEFFCCTQGTYSWNWREGFGTAHFFPLDWVYNVLFLQLVNVFWKWCLICIWVLEGSFVGSQSCFEGGTCQTCVAFEFFVFLGDCCFVDNIFWQAFVVQWAFLGSWTTACFYFRGRGVNNNISVTITADMIKEYVTWSSLDVWIQIIFLIA